MSNPSFSNIDRWLFELVEGNLTPEQVAQLEVFLMQHPELDVDRDMWELAKVETPEVVFPNQERFTKRKRPVGLYMMSGFASIAIFIAIGLYNFSSNTDPSSSVLLAEQNNSAESISTHSKSESKHKASQVQRRNSELKANDSFGGMDKANLSSITTVGQSTKGFDAIENAFLKNQIRQSNDKDLNAFNASNINSSEKSIIEPTDENSIELALTDQETQTEEKILQTTAAKHVDIPNQRTWNRLAGITETQRFEKDDYSASFASRMNKAARALSRMMDNPVALKNLKDPNYLLPGMLPTDVNFGSTGALPAVRVQAQSRLQWPGKENQQLINQVAVDGYAYGIRGGVGFQASHSYYGNGQIMNSNLAFTYSPKISVNRNILIEPSIRFKMGNKSLNSDKISGVGLAEMDRQNVQQFYPSGTQPIGQQLWYRDLGLGMLVNTKWFFAGIQGDNLFRHQDNIYSGDWSNPRRVGTHFIATVGTDYESRREQIGLSPYIVYQKIEKLQEAWLGLNTRFAWLTIGGAVSNKMDVAASIGVKFQRFSMNYNADYTKSLIWDKQLLSHQITLKYTTFNLNKRQKLINL